MTVHLFVRSFIQSYCKVTVKLMLHNIVTAITFIMTLHAHAVNSTIPENLKFTIWLVDYCQGRALFSNTFLFLCRF